MYLERLELVGFKSFLSKTTLHFEPGITAIVGPNGCGKSNVLDAIRWVLGEQSVKSLRGSAMEDVIFSGTDNKEPVSMAEATLTFDNANRFFNFDHDQVSITRRLFRSGESEYLLNKSLVRLKDIVDLLLGSGIGAESYSLVEQGKIDLVLSSRPEDRRLVFDQAAGITKYKSQKRETLRKLEETEQNLLRVNDIISEVKRQIGSLERQANKARKYKEVYEELKGKEIQAALFNKKELLAEKDGLIRQLQELEAKEVGLFQKIKEEELRIANRQSQLRALEDELMFSKNEILNLENMLTRNSERIDLNQERIKELEEKKKDLEAQILQLKSRIALDEEKLSQVRQEYGSIQKDIEDKNKHHKEKEAEFSNLAKDIKVSLENIAQAKREILELVSSLANTKNEIADSAALEQVQSARKKRLELEKAKVHEEKSIIARDLEDIGSELDNLKKTIAGLNSRICGIKDETEKENCLLSKMRLSLEKLTKEKLALESHREFIEKLKTKYADISEVLNATVYLDRLPQEKVSGLVVKIKSIEKGNRKLCGEAKPFDLDTQAILAHLERLKSETDSLSKEKMAKETHLEELNKESSKVEQELRTFDIAFANKNTTYQSVEEQFNRIKEEEEIILLELNEVNREITSLGEKINRLKLTQGALEKEQKQNEATISSEQNKIALNSNLKETLLVEITQLKTELEGLLKRISSHHVTLKILEEACQQDKNSLLALERQKEDSQTKKESLFKEIKELEKQIAETREIISGKKELLKKKEQDYYQTADGTEEAAAKIESGRKELDGLKSKLYALQMRSKDIDFKFQSIKDRILQVYKQDIEAIAEFEETMDRGSLASEIESLKQKLDTYGNVNLVAIEEHEELKQRYDFLTQQQNDLLSAKDSLHRAILKINRTTRRIFLETFARVQEEFRNYFRMLFGGGDGRLFLIDEQDPLESGIEIICRPPGKKLQNVLLLSGGEKALSAIALIFAIFKVKPTPFCVLDEIDAALDEANVDRFSRLLQEFTNQSQFLVITHNKRTIVNADVMYGITMEESGVSKIVSVKFAKEKPHLAKPQEVSAAVA